MVLIFELNTGTICTCHLTRYVSTLYRTEFEYYL